MTTDFVFNDIPFLLFEKVTIDSCCCSHNQLFHDKRLCAHFYEIILNDKKGTICNCGDEKICPFDNILYRITDIGSTFEPDILDNRYLVSSFQLYEPVSIIKSKGTQFSIMKHWPSWLHSNFEVFF